MDYIGGDIYLSLHTNQLHTNSTISVYLYLLLAESVHASSPNGKMATGTTTTLEGVEIK